MPALRLFRTLPTLLLAIWLGPACGLIAADVERERQDIVKELKDYEYYPVRPERMPGEDRGPAAGD